MYDSLFFPNNKNSVAENWTRQESFKVNRQLIHSFIHLIMFIENLLCATGLEMTKQGLCSQFHEGEELD